jgi:type IV pilus assembly protein PilN
VKYSINLASQPFRRDRAMVAGSTVVIALLVATLLALFVFIQQDSVQLAGLRDSIQRLHGQVNSASQEQARLDAVVRQPQNASVLEWSALLNTLIYHKAISWSKLLVDLEKTLPPNVKVVSIHPSIDSLNHVKLEMTLGSEKTSEPLVEAIRALENSPAFGAVTAASTNPPTQAEPLFRFRLTVNYAQKL